MCKLNLTRRMPTIGPTIAVTVRTCTVQVTSSRDFKMTEHDGGELWV